MFCVGSQTHGEVPRQTRCMEATVNICSTAGPAGLPLLDIARYARRRSVSQVAGNRRHLVDVNTPDTYTDPAGRQKLDHSHSECE